MTDAMLDYYRSFNRFLEMLLDQPGAIRAYKMTDAEGRSPIQGIGGISYKVGETVEVNDADTDVTTHCGAGINVADSVWIRANWQRGNRILVVEFTAQDIAAIPTGTDGKFRLHRCKIVGEIDPAEWGLATADAALRAAGIDPQA